MKRRPLRATRSKAGVRTIGSPFAPAWAYDWSSEMQNRMFGRCGGEEALVLAGIAAANLAPALDRSLFAERAMTGEIFAVYTDFANSPANHLRTVFRGGIVTFGLLTFVLQVLLSAGLVEVLLESRPGRRTPPYSFPSPETEIDVLL